MQNNLYPLLSSAENNLLCILCRELPEDLVESNCCSNLLCWECASSQSICPNCGKELNASNCRTNVPLKRIVDAMQTKCRIDGCSEFISPSIRKVHENNLCQYRKIQCPNSSKCELLKAKDLDLHVNHLCNYRMVFCPHECGISVPFFELENHLDYICVNTEVDCPNHCDARLKRELMKIHVAQECQYQPIDCPFSKFGCKEVINRCNTTSHLETHVIQHLSLMSNTVEKQEMEIKLLNNEMDSLKNNQIFTQIDSVIGLFGQTWNANREAIGARADFIRQKYDQLSYTNLWMFFGFICLLYLVPGLKILFFAFSAIWLFQKRRAFWNHSPRRIPKWFLVIITSWLIWRLII